MTFDRVVVINLKRRDERLQALYRRLASARWPLPFPETFDAVDGLALPAPTTWSGVGAASAAWGCAQSHLRNLEAFLLDETLQTMLVLEDDAAPCDDFAERFATFVATVPADWQMLMLGGEHVQPPTSALPGVVRCTSTHRTHAYAIKRGPMAYRLYQAWGGGVGHCDQTMATLMPRFKVYAPAPTFLVAQAAGLSDIAGVEFAERNFAELGKDVR